MAEHREALADLGQHEGCIEGRLSRVYEMLQPLITSHACAKIVKQWHLIPQLNPPPSCPSNACVQATLGVGSGKFRTVDFGGAFFSWSYCVPCVLSDTLVLRCMMFMLCVKEVIGA